MLEKFGPRDRRFVIVCAAIAVVSGVIALRYFGRAFPEASIQFAVNRSESAVVAQNFLALHGESTVGYKHATIFDYDDETKTYLERRLGLERAQEVYGKQVRLWRWSHRWFKPHEKEEIRVDVTSAGDVARFTHLYAEDTPGATIEPDSARAVAEQFLQTHLGNTPGDWDFLEGSSTQQPHRLDHSFTWKKRGLDLGDSDTTYRIRIDVAGSKVGGYEEFLDIPQAWQDDYSRLRARNDTAALVASAFLLLTVLAMVGSLVLRVRDRDVRWNTVLGFGGVAFVLQLLAALNQFDLEKFQYETQNGYASFVAGFLQQALLGALASGGLIVLVTAAAEPIYRERHPSKLALPSYFTWRGLRTKSFFQQTVLGLTMMLFFAAYQSLFYLGAARLGAWAPLEVPYSNMLNTAIPWALVLFVGFFPAVSEEFISRMFSVPFLDKHLGRLGLPRRAAAVLAILVASYVWGFAHSNYPNQPFWIRGVEVGTAGVIVSAVFWRWGILATLVWHYTVDAFYTSLLMLRSGNTYFSVSGAVTAGLMLVPLALSLVLYFRHRGFEPDTGLRNQDLPGPRPAPARAEAEEGFVRTPYVPVPRRYILATATVAAALLLLFAVPVERPGDGIQLESNRKQALAAAQAHLHRLGGDPAEWRTAVQMMSRYDPQVGRYVLQHGSMQRLNALYADRLRTPVWRVRFFRNDEREEWKLNLPVNEIAGDSIPLWAFEHVVPDSAAGDTLVPAAAQLLAGDFLREQGIEPGDLDLKESQSERQKARVDHTFEWEVPDSTLGEAGVRYVVVVRGGEVAGLRPYLHLPEAWVRADGETSVLQRILWVASRGVLALIVFAVTALFVLYIRRIPRRAAIFWGVIAGLLSLVILSLRWQSDILWSYETTTPYQLFVTGAGVSLVVQFLVLGLLAAVMVGTLLAVRPQVRALVAGRNDERYVRDGVILAVVGLGLQIGLRRLAQVLGGMAEHSNGVDELLLLSAAARPAPWLDEFASLARSLVLLLPLFGLLVHAGQRFLGTRRALLVTFVAAVIFAADGARSMPEFGVQLVISLLSAGALAWAVLRLFRGNELAYVLCFVGGRTLGTALGWLRQPSLDAQSTGVMVGALGASVLIVAYVLASRGARRVSEVERGT